MNIAATIPSTVPSNSANSNAVIKNVFVLMLENRAFDHMLGFAGISGVVGLDGAESNSYEGTPYTVQKGADWSMPVSPGHEFADVLAQLAGGTATYPCGGTYPPIDNSGFVWDYVNSPSKDEGGATCDLGEIMKCYDTVPQLPVLYTLATQFAVCDNWYASLPGPTWPNRFFVHGASSSGLDDSPSDPQMIEWETIKGFRYDNGSIFDLLDNTFRARKLKHPWRIYRGVSWPLSGAIPGVAALHNIDIEDTFDFKKFDRHVNDKDGYPYFYTFIEPNYGDIVNHSYKGGQSQHPRDDVRSGEALIKSVYDSLRRSPLWENSLLIITYDEHGGFYDHVAPLACPAPGDSMKWSQHGFTFEQYGVRVPAVVVSPFIAAGTVDHTLYDHASVPNTLEALAQMSTLTGRDYAANNVTALLSLSQARSDTPVVLPDPATGGPLPFALAPQADDADPDTLITDPNMPAFLFVVAKQKAKLDARAGVPEALAASNAFMQARNARTVGQARALINEVMTRVNAAEPDGGA